MAEVSEQDAEQAEIAKARGNTAFQGVRSVSACKAPPPMHGAFQQADAVIHSRSNLHHEVHRYRGPLHQTLLRFEHTGAHMSDSGLETMELMHLWCKRYA
jgi:hypothetical protein